MNIYIHVEVSLRELDSKLLLATLAAARGHQVIVSDLHGIILGLQKGILPPGIFHTKSVTPGTTKIARHQLIIDNGSLITSIDEESSLKMTHDQFAVDRYSEHSIGQASAIFGWGSNDTETLKKIYPKYYSKIHMTGSPRVDLWNSTFSNYWGAPRELPNKPFLLVSSNLNCSTIQPFHEGIRKMKKGGYFKRDPISLKKMFGEMAGNYLKMYAFIEGIQNLANNNNGYDIVLRPHPSENAEAWKIHFEDTPSVHIIREGSITGWVNNAFAIMHNSCTTALEATVAGKPVVSYVPFKNKYDYEVPNLLGYRVESPEELSIKVNTLFKEMKSVDQKKIIEKVPEIFYKKIYLDKDEFAAEKIIKVWESLDNSSLSKNISWKKFQLLLKFLKLRRIGGKLRKQLFPSWFGSYKKNYKFPPLDKNDICERVNKLQTLLKINKKMDCKVLSEQTIVIKLN